MSSVRVRATNKILDKLGATKPSKNVQFDLMVAKFDQVANDISSFDSALRGFIISLKGFHVAANVLTKAIEDLVLTKEASEPMKQLAQDLRIGFGAIDTTFLEQSVDQFEKRVLRPSNGWMGRANAMKQQVAAYQEEKLVFDHYTRKVLAMREARDKRAGSGKAEKPKDVDKMVRNEQKLASATVSYNKLSDTTVANLRDFTASRDETIIPIVQRLIKFRIEYAAALNEKSRALEHMVASESAYEGVMGKLEAFVKNFTGIRPPPPEPSSPSSPEKPPRKTSGFAGISFGRKDKSSSPQASATESREPTPPNDQVDPEVQSATFQSFVGEASPDECGTHSPSPDFPSRVDLGSPRGFGELGQDFDGHGNPFLTNSASAPPSAPFDLNGSPSYQSGGNPVKSTPPSSYVGMSTSNVNSMDFAHSTNEPQSTTMDFMPDPFGMPTHSPNVSSGQPEWASFDAPFSSSPASCASSREQVSFTSDFDNLHHNVMGSGLSPNGQRSDFNPF